jgi:F-type H+-transporting ATPase subunit epsilon
MAENNIITLELITPSKIRFTGEVKEFTAPVVLGEINVMPEHTLYMAKLQPGVVTLATTDGSSEIFAVSEGFVEIEENKAIILVEDAYAPDEIEVAYVEKELQEAEKQLDELDYGSEEYLEAALNQKRLTAMLLVKQP